MSLWEPHSPPILTVIKDLVSVLNKTLMHACLRERARTHTYTPSAQTFPLSYTLKVRADEAGSVFFLLTNNSHYKASHVARGSFTHCNYYKQKPRARPLSLLRTSVIFLRSVGSSGQKILSHGMLSLFMPMIVVCRGII